MKRLLLPICFVLCLLGCNTFEPIEQPLTDYDRLLGSWVTDSVSYDTIDYSGNQYHHVGILIDRPSPDSALYYDFVDSTYLVHNQRGFQVSGNWSIRPKAILMDGFQPVTIELLDVSKLTVMAMGPDLIVVRRWLTKK